MPSLQNQDFLASAIETGRVDAFTEYLLRWITNVLGARGIAPVFLHENIQQISRHLQGLMLETVAAEVSGFVSQALSAALSEEAPASPAQVVRGELATAQALYLQAILHGRRESAVLIATEAAQQGHELTGIYTGLLQASMYEVGRLWQINQISVAQEHMATVITQYVIAHLYPLIQMPEVRKGRMVITGVEGEYHQVGANIVADVLESAGWDVRFLGTNTPGRAVLQAVEEHRADVLGISATMLFNLPNVRRLIEQARAFAEA